MFQDYLYLHICIDLDYDLPYVIKDGSSFKSGSYGKAKLHVLLVTYK